MAWHTRLSLNYSRSGAHTELRHVHDGPLRVLKTLYPEGRQVAHNVLVHPPSGLVGGDSLAIDVHVGPGAHGFITTPGATRFYRSEGQRASQHASLSLDAGARLEWLPLEALAYSGSIAENRVDVRLAPGAEMIGWDVTAFGLPAAHQPFTRGSFLQHLELKGEWLERGCIDAKDAGLMNGPLGLAGKRCLCTLFFASGDPISEERREKALAIARAAKFSDGVIAAATGPGPHVLTVRLLADLVEPAMRTLREIHGAWRPALWNLPAITPRVWAT